MSGARGTRRASLTAGAAALAAAGLVAGCGGERQDADEPSGTYRVDVVSASFPKRQHLASSSELRITVRNADRRTIPDLAMTISGDDPKMPGGGFSARSSDAALADPSRAIWVVDDGPRGGDTAYTSTWAVGPLRAGATQTFTWKVTPVVSGQHDIRWHVAAGLDGRAQAQTAAGDEASGTFRVTVSRTAAQATVDPKTGEVVRGGGE